MAPFRLCRVARPAQTICGLSIQFGRVVIGFDRQIEHMSRSATAGTARPASYAAGCFQARRSSPIRRAGTTGFESARRSGWRCKTRSGREPPV